MPGKNGLGESLHELYFSCFAFLDDCYLVAASSSDCQIMLDDVLAEFAKLGLQLHPDKCKWIADKHGCPFDCGYHGIRVSCQIRPFLHCSWSHCGYLGVPIILSTCSLRFGHSTTRYQLSVFPHHTILFRCYLSGDLAL